ncbi:arsenate reductase family protein [Longimicrobium sp.]|uniref:arsenate reductase family protein n=1 Tax=Longimicrobium sp. TaxID=2029185 RepID=UPI002BC2DD83|nr:ArsC/Spx/MgsR family protein [Longimicrobium sp.]HSU14595.1 ArsC/Spx/MgsR family protein [Longimicrobium sp.]
MAMATEVQVFGTRSCNETKKALRFFKERRIKTHFVDLKERPASAGELKRFGQKFGWEALLDRDGKHFRGRGLHVAHVSEARIPTLLEDDPMLLVTPLVRSGNVLAIGWNEAQWRDFVKQAG